MSRPISPILPTHTTHGTRCNDIYFDGHKTPDGNALDNCNIYIEEIEASHNGTWTCLVDNMAQFSDTVNITVKGAIIGMPF